jgi:osmoprotectant transport system permease protein
VTSAPRAATRLHGRRIVQQPVLLLLWLAAAAAASGLAFLRVAPNRLLSGAGVGGFEVLHAAPAGWTLAFIGCAAVVGVAAFAPPGRRSHVAVLLAAAVWGSALLALAGAEAARRAAVLPDIARVSLGGGFWCLLSIGGLIAADAMQRLALPAVWRGAVLAALMLPPAALVGAGHLDALSLLKELANRREVFDAAALQHLQIVGLSLACALAVGVPLGLAAVRSARLARPLFAVLNVVQTVPSIALFALLMAPLAALAAALAGLPGVRVQGIGLLPAVIALTLYALLPVVHGVVAGLASVPAAVVEAADGMGLSRSQRLRQVELPLALPVLLSGLRVTVVQLIGLAAVAALIGAGGFGALMFQGLFSSAIDLVLLGVLPVVALALVADAAFGAWVAAVEGSAR